DKTRTALNRCPASVSLVGHDLAVRSRCWRRSICEAEMKGRKFRLSEKQKTAIVRTNAKCVSAVLRRVEIAGKTDADHFVAGSEAQVNMVHLAGFHRLEQFEIRHAFPIAFVTLSLQPRSVIRAARYRIHALMPKVGRHAEGLVRDDAIHLKIHITQR